MEKHGKKRTKNAQKSYDVCINQTYPWANKTLPTPYLLQNLLYVSISKIPTKIEKIAYPYKLSK
jgi:hypothetical protein